MSAVATHPARAAWIAGTFGAAAVEMEGGAIGQVCYINKVKFGVIRAISDGGGDDSHIDFAAFAERAAEMSVEITLGFLKELN